MEDHIHPGKVNANVRARCLPPPGQGSQKRASGGLYSPNGAFLGKLYKIKVEEHPQYSRGRYGQIRSLTSPRCPAGGPSATGTSAGMVPSLTGLKLGMEMRTHPERSMPMCGLGSPTPRVREP